jgi:hypothetical protein
VSSIINPKILEIIVDPDISIGLILGSRRKGKSVLGYGIIDDFAVKQGYAAYVFGLPESKEHLLPSHIKPIDDLDEVPDGSAFIVDEAYKEFYSRMSMSSRNKFIDTLVALSGQKRLKSIYITQHARRLERGIVGEVDFILFKKPSLMQMQFDRPQLKPLLLNVYKAFQELKPPEGVSLQQYQKRCTYVFSEDFVGMVEESNSPPEWWNEDISKAYAGISVKEQRDTEKQIVYMLRKYVGGTKDPRYYDERRRYVPKSKREKTAMS